MAGRKKEVLDENGRSRGYYSESNRVNDLTGREWVFWTRSVITKPYPPNLQHALRKPPRRSEAARIFAPISCAHSPRRVRAFSTRSWAWGACCWGRPYAGRNAVGVDINPEWIEIYHEVCTREDLPVQETIGGDALEVLAGLRPAASTASSPTFPTGRWTRPAGRGGHSRRWGRRRSPLARASSPASTITPTPPRRSGCRQWAMCSSWRRDF